MYTQKASEYFREDRGSWVTWINSPHCTSEKVAGHKQQARRQVWNAWNLPITQKNKTKKPKASMVSNLRPCQLWEVDLRRVCLGTHSETGT